METNSENTKPAPEKKEASRERPRSAQDQRIANDIAATEQMVGTLLTDATVRVPLGKRGFDTQKIQLGADLQAAADAAYGARQQAIGKQSKSTSELEEAEQEAREHYADFRETVRTEFSDRATQETLGVTGEVPRDLQTFVTSARASYTAAKDPAVQPALADAGYPAATLDEELDSLKALLKLDEGQSKAIGDAVKATRTRNTAYRSMKGWVSKLRRRAKVAFRKEPELAKKLDF